MLNFYWISNYYRVLYYRPTLLPAVEWPTDMLFCWVNKPTKFYTSPKKLFSLPKLLDGWDHCCTIQRMQLCFHFPKIVELITKTVRWLRSLLYDSKNATVFIFPSRCVTVSNYYLRDKFSESKHWGIFVEHKYQSFNRVFLNTGQLVLFSGFWQF